MKPIDDRFKHLASMSWEDIGKYGTYYGGRLILDIMACRAFTLAASTVGRELTCKITTLFESSTAPERLAEVAGIGKIAIEEGVKTAHKVVDIIKENPQINSIKETRLNRIKGIAELCDWSMPEGGKMINGRWYTQHALERMAPDTIEVRAILSKRAIAKGKMPGTKPFKDYVDPRGIPPSVVEDAIENGASMIGKELGTLHCEGGSIHVVIIDEKLGNVVSIIPK